MRKLLSLPFKYAAMPFIYVGIILLVLSSLARNGWDKTDKKLDEVNELFEGLGKKMTYYHNIGSKALKKDAAARDKIARRQADRRFLDQLDDFMAAVNGSVQGGLHTKYNRKIASE